MKALVTGAAGFIGSRISEALLAHGYDVTGIDNLSTGRADNFPSGGSLIVDDIREWMPLRTDWDVVYHCAASYKDKEAWERDASTNVLGTINAVREAQLSGAKLIYFQTSLCYGPNPKSPITVDTPLNPVGSYAVSKTAGEMYIRDSGIDYVSFRLANIYGPRNVSGPIPTFWKRLTEGKPCTVVDSRRDFVFIDDLVWVAVNARNKGHGVYHISSGTDQSIAHIYDAVAGAIGLWDEATWPQAESVSRGPDDVATLLLDPSTTQAEFGWTAQTDLRTGVERAVAWYQSHGVSETYTHLAQKG